MWSKRENWLLDSELMDDRFLIGPRGSIYCADTWWPNLQPLQEALLPGGQFGRFGQNCYWCKWRQPVGELAINEIYNSKVDPILLRMSPEWKRWSSTRTILKTKEESETYMNTYITYIRTNITHKLYITYNTYIYTITNMLETSGSTVHGNIALLKLVSKPDNTRYRSACLPKLVIQSCNPFLHEFKISPDFI